MLSEVRSAALAAAAMFLLLQTAAGTSVPRVSFEELTDNSDAIVTGNVVRSWTAWDAGHRYIWTHYELAVDAAPKGALAKTIEIAEPGGVVDGMGMTIAGSVHYTPGEKVVVFAQRMPNGYLRTTGWGQGKYSVDRGGILHADTALRNAEFVKLKPNVVGAATPLSSLSGITLTELSARIAARIRLAQSRGKVQQQ